MGMVSNRTSDIVSLCLLDNDSLRDFCYEKPLLNLTMVQHTHPVMSGLIESGERFVVLEAVTKDLRPFNKIKDPTVPSINSSLMGATLLLLACSEGHPF